MIDIQMIILDSLVYTILGLVAAFMPDNINAILKGKQSLHALKYILIGTIMFVGIIGLKTYVSLTEGAMHAIYITLLILAILQALELVCISHQYACTIPILVLVVITTANNFYEGDIFFYFYFIVTYLIATKCLRIKETSIKKFIATPLYMKIVRSTMKVMAIILAIHLLWYL